MTRTVIITPVGGECLERALEAEAENRALHGELAALREQLLRERQDALHVIGLYEAKWMEALREIEELKRKRRNAGRKRRGKSSRTQDRRKAEEIAQTAEAARQARLSPTSRGRTEFEIIIPVVPEPDED